METKGCLDPRELARFLGVNNNTAYRLMRAADFPSIRISERRLIVPKVKLDEWLSAQANKKT